MDSFFVGYMSGGAGYAISREGLRRFVVDGLETGICRKDNRGDEDVEFGKCLDKIGVIPGESRDKLGRGRFFPFSPSRHMKPGHTKTGKDVGIHYSRRLFFLKQIEFFDLLPGERLLLRQFWTA